MSDPLIRECRDLILRIDPGRLAAKPFPLLHIDDLLSCFDLPPLRLPDLDVVTPGEIPDVKPSFKNLTDDILLCLRHAVHAQTEQVAVSKWAERLLRFCELRYRTLYERSIGKCGTRVAAELHLLHLAAFLADQAIHSGDVRVLNTVLKLSDLNWLLDRKAIKRKLCGNGEEFYSALFQFRVILATECALHRLHRGMMP